MLAHAQIAMFPAYRPLRAGWRAVGRMNGPAPQDFNALIQRVAQARDRTAFAALFDHFAPRIKSYLMRLGAAPALAEDLAQDAMLNMWRKAHLFDAAKASASTWLFTIARNLRIDAIRREKRPQLDPQDFTPEPDAEASDVMALHDDEARLREALKVLPPDQAAVIQQSFFGDKPHSQIAAELGIPLGTVKSRLRLAMARLRGALGDEMGDLS